ncbi:MAG: S-layer homology domain-containing protein, partial [Clostridia bacterium]|nr:S-layer homology domain-containing protein [Clostridia bacterium]
KDMVEHYALYPNYSCNRMMSVYYIWCAAGSPECKTPLKFSDTQEQKYEKYYEAIAWAVENGITYGTSETTFGPGKSCTRAEIVTFLWRAASKGLI